MSITTDKLDTLYAKLKPSGVTMTALLAKACAAALAQHPVIFAGELRRFDSLLYGFGLPGVRSTGHGIPPISSLWHLL